MSLGAEVESWEPESERPELRQLLVILSGRADEVHQGESWEQGIDSKSGDDTADAMS